MAQLTPEALTVDMTMSAFTAEGLLDNAASLPAMGPDNFETFRARLVAKAAKAFKVTHDGKVLIPRSTTAGMTDEGDVEFRITYDPVSGGHLRLEAVFLNDLPDGHVATLLLEDQADNRLGWDELSKDYTVLEADLPGKPQKPSAGAASSPPSPPARAQPSADATPPARAGAAFPHGRRPLLS